MVALGVMSTVLTSAAAGAAAGVAAQPMHLPGGRSAAASRELTPAAPYVLPVAGSASVLTPFRAPTTPYGPGHRGVDLALAIGGAVRAAGAGIVSHAGQVAGRGTVSIEHLDGLRTTYEPIDATVRTGQHVVAGQVIGTLLAGHASCLPASCLHWGALADGEYLDPMGLLHGLQVRLLPWDQARG